MTFSKAISRVSLMTFVSLLVISCGGGGGGGGVSTTSGSDLGSDSGSSVAVAASTGSVTLLATDAPTDQFKEINLTVTKAEIFSDEGRETLFSGEKTIDLLQLEEVTEVFSVSEVPAGNYGKIRLTLSQIELVFHDEALEPVYPKLPGNGKLDLNPRGKYYVDADNPLTVELDFDAEKSLHIHAAGKNGEKFNFRPVVFIKKVEGSHDTKLIRQSGYVANLNGDTMMFDLCLGEEGPGPLSNEFEGGDDTPDCVPVDPGAGPSSFFRRVSQPCSCW